LRPRGWRAHGMSLDRFERTRVDGIPCRWGEGIYLGVPGFHRWASLCPVRGTALPRRAEEEFRARAGSVPVTRDQKSGGLRFRIGLSSVQEIDRPGRRTRPDRKLSGAARDGLVWDLLAWLRRKPRGTWRAYHVDFQMQRSHRAAGCRWGLSSTIHFFSKEGLSWDTWMMGGFSSRSKADRPEIHAFLKKVRRQLRSWGLNVQGPYLEKKGSRWLVDLIFGRNNLPTGELLRKLKKLAEWKPS
jgi:hypothetical protein